MKQKTTYLTEAEKVFLGMLIDDFLKDNYQSAVPKIKLLLSSLIIKLQINK